MREKRKYTKRQHTAEENNERLKLDIHGDAKRGIVAVFLFALTILFIFGFFGGAGVLGGYLDKIGGAIFGWGKWLLPLLLILVGIVLLFRKRTIYYVTKIIGLVVAFISVLGFFHIYFPTEVFLEVAKAGKGGGYIGYGLSWVLVSLTGKAAGTVVLVSLFLIGIIVAFNISILNFIHRLRKGEVGDSEGEIEEEKYVGEKSSKEAGKGEEKVDLAGNDLGENIKKIEFVEDASPDNSTKEQGGITENNNSLKGGSALDKSGKNGFNNHSIAAHWQLPPLTLLEESNKKPKSGDIQKNTEIIQKTFQHFGIDMEIGEVQIGPTVTQYSFRPAVGVKLTRITSLGNDLSLALAAHPIRIEAPIPGKSLVGVEVPNKTAAVVKLKNMLEEEYFDRGKSTIVLALGQDVGGNYIFEDLSRMPHLLIAGATGTGKSVCINNVLISLLYQNSPEDLKLILVDPKRVELSLYNGIPHLLSDVIVENSKVVNALKWAVREMERRYRMLQDTGSRDLESYEQKRNEGKKRVYTDPETNKEVKEEMEKLPYIVIVIDELADLMAAHGKEVEGAIIRLAQMARAVGIHLIISTQRPSVEVLTGLIKANITTRISFQVATQIDARTILDMSGAEKLLGNGDMLFLSSRSPKPKRIQSVFVSESEVKKVVNFIKNQKKEKGIGDEGKEEITDNGSLNSQGGIDFGIAHEENCEDSDALYEEAKKIVLEAKKASSSMLQRRLRIGYSRAARLIDMLEENGIVSPADGSRPRDILPGIPTASESQDSLEPTREDLQEDQEKRDKWQM